LFLSAIRGALLEGGETKRNSDYLLETAVQFLDLDIGSFESVPLLAIPRRLGGRLGTSTFVFFCSRYSHYLTDDIEWSPISVSPGRETRVFRLDAPLSLLEYGYACIQYISSILLIGSSIGTRKLGYV
jgi:hypothetical protein